MKIRPSGRGGTSAGEDRHSLALIQMRRSNNRFFDFGEDAVAVDPRLIDVFIYDGDAEPYRAGLLLRATDSDLGSAALGDAL